MSVSRASRSKRKAWFAAEALALAIALAAPGLVLAKPADRLPELLEVSGFYKAFDLSAAGLKAYMKQSLTGMKESKDSVNRDYWDKVIVAADPAIEAAFSAQAVRGEFLRAIDGRLDDDDLDAIIAFDTSPFGARMIAMELAAMAKEPEVALKKLDEVKEELRNDPERVEVLTQMERSMRAGEAWTDQAFNVARALSIGLASANADMMLSPDDIEIIDEALADKRPAIAAEYQKNAIALLAYVYHDASVSDLRDYLAVLKSPTGQKYYDAMVRAIKQVYVKAGNDFGWALIRELGKERR